MSNLNRIYIEQEINLNIGLSLTKEQSHYLVNVLRRKIGDKIKIFNGRNGEWLAEITFLNKKSMIINPIQLLKEQNSEIDICLIFSPIKNSRLPYLIEKATELGVTKLMPVILENSIGKIFNIERAKIIAIEASEQCERLAIPQIDEIVSFNNLIKNWDQNRKILFCNEKKINDLSVKSISQTLVAKDKYAILIGPEGGFSENERAILNSLPYIFPVHLGPRILRAETAALVALTCFQFAIENF